MRRFIEQFAMNSAKSPDGVNGACLDRQQPFWQLEGPISFPELLRALQRLLPEGCIMYLEAGSPSRALRSFFDAHSVPEETHIAVGTLWPKPRFDHVPATPRLLTQLADIAESHAEPEIAIHFHVYHCGRVLLEWYDAFSDPMYLSSDLPEDLVRRFADTLSMTCRARQGEQSG